MKDMALPRSLKVSIAVIICLNIFVFSFLGISINNMCENTIENIGTAYMSEMNKQVSLHFETIIDLRLTMAESIAHIAEGEGSSGYGSKDEIEYGARARQFLCAALYSADGRIEMIYGDRVEFDHPEAFLESLKNGEHKAAFATDSSGNGVILFGVPCEYPMSDGSASLAMVVGLSSKYMGQVLFLESDTSLVYSYVIRKDGSYVVRDQGGKGENYFDRLYKIFDGQNEEADTYIKQMTAAMDANEDYSVILKSGQSRRHLYCTNLPYCDWYLVTVLPFGGLDQAISGMGSHWLTIVYVSLFVVMAMLLCIFFQYFGVFRKQVSQLKRMNTEMDGARKAAEKAQKEAEQANAAKQEFLSSMSHDIRTPMNAIIGMTSLATARTHNPEQVQEYLRKIALSSKHLLGLINDVLDISKIESGKMTLNVEQMWLREVMEGIANIILPQIKLKNQQFNADAYGILAEDVCCDSVRLNQVLLNLLSNAVKYTQEGGTIQLALFQEEAPPEKGENYIRTHITVKDNGIGMSAEFVEHVFDSYSRADSRRVHKTEGAGLGMAIAKHIVSAMGGNITVKSEPHKGTEFQVVLDLEKAEAEEYDMVLPAWKMLVVDDDETLCRTAVESLDSIGIQADWTLSGEKAIEMVRKHHQMRDDYQIVLLDWKLPGMDGLMVARHIRRIVDTDLPIILISAYDWNEFEAEAKEAGINGFIAKPLFKSTLYHGLKKYMGIDKKRNEAEKNPDLSGRRILVAEDNDLNWEILSELLADIGMELEWAENGKICLDKFRESEKGQYDAILMDVRMPVMTGYEATEAIRALDHPDAKTIPIIAMTADAFSEDIKRCLDCGMNAHTAKPINLEEILSLLRKYML